MQKRNLRRNAEYYIEKAKDIHGNKYNYSKVVYQGVKTKVEIVCPEHGSFWQTLDNHTNVGHGCPGCSNNKKKTTKQFIEQARGVHGNRYDYSETIYKTNQHKVKIICKEHGEFYQAPSSHLRGSNCPKCSGHYTKTTEEFIEESISIHGNKYEYEKVYYKDSGTPVTITCKAHGDFEQVPYNHLTSKQGCPSCGNEKKGILRRGSKEDFVSKSLQVHPEGNFDYSEVVYEKNNVKVKITCKYGHSFYQTPANHMTGFGCPECALGWVSSGYYKTNGPAKLYVLKIENQFIKVGISKNFNHRLNQLRREIMTDEIEIIETLDGKANEIYLLEKRILRQSNLIRYCPDVSFPGDTECLNLTELPKVQEIIKNSKESVKKENYNEI